MKTLVAAAIASWALFLTTSAIQAQGTLYKWTDAQGRVHYSNTPTRNDAKAVDDALPPASNFESPEPIFPSMAPSESPPDTAATPPTTPSTQPAPDAEGTPPAVAEAPPAEGEPSREPSQAEPPAATEPSPPESEPTTAEPQNPSSVFQRSDDYPSF